MNDPNGFSFYQGECHLFYQYNPYSVCWDAMHWGHAKTADFIRWEYLPAALAPDEAYDAAGVFSGGAVEAEGKHVLLYTGVSERKTRMEKKRSVRYSAWLSGTERIMKRFPKIRSSTLPCFRKEAVWRISGIRSSGRRTAYITRPQAAGRRTEADRSSCFPQGI